MRRSTIFMADLRLLGNAGGVNRTPLRDSVRRVHSHPMRMHVRARTIVVVVFMAAFLALSGCAPAPGPVQQPGGEPNEAPRQSSRTLVLIAQAEPVSVAAKSIRDTGGRRIGATLRLFNAGLAILDERQVAHPYLVDELPRLGTDSWRLLPDG